MAEVDELTLYEFGLLMEGHRLREQDRQEEMHWQAWLNRVVSATKMKGKKTEYVFKRFSDFYKVPQKAKRTRRSNKKQEKLKQMMLKANRGGGSL